MYELMVFKVFQKFSLPNTIINFLFTSLKLLAILKMLTETLLKKSDRCSLVPISHWLQGKCARINLPQNHRRLPVSTFSVKNAVLGPLQRIADFLCVGTSQIFTPASSRVFHIFYVDSVRFHSTLTSF